MLDGRVSHRIIVYTYIILFIFLSQAEDRLVFLVSGLHIFGYSLMFFFFLFFEKQYSIVVKYMGF